MEIRYAKRFDGLRIVHVLQCRQGINYPWVDVPTEWATPEDERNYRRAVEEEDRRSER